MPWAASPIECQARVGFREVIVRADLDRTVGGVDDSEPDDRTAVIESESAFIMVHFARNHGIGWCTVTSFVPSGKVAST